MLDGKPVRVYTFPMAEAAEWKKATSARLTEDVRNRIDAWRNRQRVPPSRSAAMAALIVIALDAEDNAGKKDAKR